MHNFKKRLLSFVLALSMVLAVGLPLASTWTLLMPVWAEGESEPTNVALGKWVTVNNGNSTEAYDADGWGAKALTDGVLDYGAWLGNFNAVYTSPEAPTILTVDLDGVYDLSQVTVNPYGGAAFSAYIMPLAYTVEVYDVVNGAWVQVGAETECYANNTSNPDFANEKTPSLDYPIATPIAANAVRMVITQDSTCNIGTTAMLTAVGEIQAIGVESEALPPLGDEYFNVSVGKNVSVNNGNAFFNNYDSWDLSFLCDGSAVNSWHSNITGSSPSTPEAPTILTVDLAGTYDIGSVKIYPYAGAGYAGPVMPLDFTIEVFSIETQDWVVLADEQDCYIGNATNENFVANFPATPFLEYRPESTLYGNKVRVVITEDSIIDIGGTCMATVIGELEVMGAMMPLPENFTNIAEDKPVSVNNGNTFFNNYETFDLSFITDGDPALCWHSAVSGFNGSTEAAPTILTVDLQGAYEVGSVKVYPAAFANYAAPTMPYKYSVELLTLEGEWVEIGRETECFVGNSKNANFVANYPATEFLEYRLPANIKASQARIVITQDSLIDIGAPCMATNIGELVVLGAMCEGATPVYEYKDAFVSPEVLTTSNTYRPGSTFSSSSYYILNRMTVAEGSTVKSISFYAKNTGTSDRTMTFVAAAWNTDCYTSMQSKLFTKALTVKGGFDGFITVTVPEGKTMGAGDWVYGLNNSNNSQLVVGRCSDAAPTNADVNWVSSHYGSITSGKKDGTSSASYKILSYVTYEKEAGYKVFSDANNTKLTQDKAHVILLMGQSNATGISLSSKLSSDLQTKYSAGFPNIQIAYYADNNISTSFVPVKLGQGHTTEAFGAEIGLADYLNTTYPGEKFYIIKSTASGTNLHTNWKADDTAIGSIYTSMVNNVAAALKVLDEQGLDPEIFAMCWMQGESDADTVANARAYATNLSNMYDRLSARFTAYQAPGGMALLDAAIFDGSGSATQATNHWKLAAIVNAQKQILASANQNIYFLDTNVLDIDVRDEASAAAESGGTTIDYAHYDADDMIELGKLFGAAVEDVIDNAGDYLPKTSDPVVSRYKTALSTNAEEVDLWNTAALTDGRYGEMTSCGLDRRPVGWHNNASTFGTTSAQNPILLTVKLGDYYEITSLRVMPGSVKGVYNTAASFLPMSYDLQVYDGAEWHTVASDSGVYAPDPATVLTYKLETPVTGNEVRMVITGESAHGYTIVGEFEACGVLDPDYEPPIPEGGEDQSNNIAYRKPVTSTNSLDRTDFNVSYLTDGDQTLGWHNANFESADQMSATNPTRIVIDLEGFYDVTKLTLKPLITSTYSGDVSFIPQGFDIQVSTNGQTWTTLRTVNGAYCTASSELVLDYDLTGEDPVVARWIRLNIVQESAYGPINTIGEICVEGTAVEGAKTDPLMDNVALNKEVIASDSNENPGSWGAMYLTDGVSFSSTPAGWHSPIGDYYRPASEEEPFYLTINLGRKYSVSRVNIAPVVTYNNAVSVIPRDFDIEYSLDGKTWYVAAEIRDASCPANSGAMAEFDFNPVDAVLVRLKITKHSAVRLYTEDDYASAIGEIEVYGTPYKIEVPADQLLPEAGQAGLDSGIVRDENAPKKYVTLRFDDCTTQDAQIVEILKKYNVYGATFYLNTGLYGTEWDWVTELTGASHIRYTKDQLAAIYTGFDIAAHGYEHLSLVDLSDSEIIAEVQDNVDDIAELSFFGKTPVGMAYAGGTSEVNDHVREVLMANTTVRYGMGTTSTYSFSLPETFMNWQPTACFTEAGTSDLVDQFIQTKPSTDMVLTLWGHGYEFDQYDFYDEFDAMLAKLTAAAAEDGSEIVFVTNAQFYQLFKNEIPAMPVPVEVEDGRVEQLHMVVTGDGYDIYNPPSGYDGYRYGAQYLYEDDGKTVHAYFSCIGTGSDEWDWITYRKSTDGGNTWGTEKVVLTCSQSTTENYSVCDPGVVKAGDYYYIAYSSTLNSKGKTNNVYVARSKNPDGPFDKWTGNGWGGVLPQPLFYCDDTPEYYGIGEPSMVVKGDTMYIYYTYWAEGDRDYCMVATADLTTENWPATIVEHGVATRKINSMFQSDSLDVKYVEDYDKFIAIGAGHRFTEHSFIAVFESSDGIHFEPVDAVRQGTYDALHNVGLSSGVDGHINIAEDADLLRVVYSYEGVDNPVTNAWATRVQPIAISLSKNNSIATEIAADNKPNATVATGSEVSGTIAVRLGASRTATVMDDTYAIQVGGTANAYVFTLAYNTSSKNFKYSQNTASASWTVTVGDESIISVNKASPLTITGKKAGMTYFDVTYSGHTTRAWVVVTDTAPSGSTVMSVKPVHDQYTLYWGDMSAMSVQLRAAVTYTNYTYTESGVDESSPAITFSGYDTDIITVDENGFVTAVGVGTTTVTMTCKGVSTTVPVTVSIDPEDSKLNMPGKPNCRHNNTNDVVTAPTCAAPGFTTHTCAASLCGYTWIDTIVPATGHEESSSTYDPATGTRTYGTCSICGKSPETFVTDWSQSVLVKIDESLKMYFYAWIDKSVVAPTLQITRDGRTYTVAGSVVRSAGDAVEYVFAFEGVTPQHADTVLSAELYCDGYKLLTKSCSLQQYIDERKADEALDETESDLLAALEAYFAALENAQTGANNDVNVDGFTNVTATDKKVTGNGSFATFKSATVGFGNDIRIRFTLELADGVNFADLTFKVKVNDGTEVDVAAGLIKVNGSTVTIYTDAIAATNLDDVYAITVYNGETAGASFTYSVKSYVYAFQSATGESEDQVLLVKALYNYGLSAKAYANAQ